MWKEMVVGRCAVVVDIVKEEKVGKKEDRLSL